MKMNPMFALVAVAALGFAACEPKSATTSEKIDDAKEMVDAAFRAGVEVVKHQTHIVEDEMSGAAKKVIPGNADVSIYEIMERCSLNEAEELELKNYVEGKGMIFISSPLKSRIIFFMP